MSIESSYFHNFNVVVMYLCSLLQCWIKKEENCYSKPNLRKIISFRWLVLTGPQGRLYFYWGKCVRSVEVGYRQSMLAICDQMEHKTITVMVNTTLGRHHAIAFDQPLIICTIIGSLHY